MATVLHNRAKAESARGNFDWPGGAFRAMLCDAGYVPDPDIDFVDSGGAGDPARHEISTKNYIGGAGGSGRKALMDKAVRQNNEADRAELTAADLSWTALGPPAGGPVVAVVVVFQEGASDADSLIIGSLDITSQQVNGSAFRLNFSDNGGRVFQLA